MSTVKAVIPLLFCLGVTACDPVVEVQDTDGDLILDRVDSCPTLPETYNNVFDRDGCPDSPADLYQAVRTDVEAFWGNFFASILGRQYLPITAMDMYSGSLTTACGVVGFGAFYCPAQRAVYLERSFMLDQLNRVGDFAPAVIIAHEIGHHTQLLVGITGNVISIQSELQADCLAGNWAASASARGLLDFGDLQEAYVSLFEFGDAPGTPWFDPTAHGTPAQRQQAFAHGFSGATC